MRGAPFLAQFRLVRFSAVRLAAKLVHPRANSWGSQMCMFFFFPLPPPPQIGEHRGPLFLPDAPPRPPGTTATTGKRRGAGVDERGGLENR